MWGDVPMQLFITLGMENRDVTLHVLNLFRHFDLRLAWHFGICPTKLSNQFEVCVSMP
jgi:hypothetical protein